MVKINEEESHFLVLKKWEYYLQSTLILWYLCDGGRSKVSWILIDLNLVKTLFKKRKLRLEIFYNKFFNKTKQNWLDFIPEIIHQHVFSGADLKY